MKVYIRAEAKGPGISGAAVDGLNEIASAMERMASRGVRLRPVMGSIGNILLRSVHQNFESEGRPKWKARRALTVQSMRNDAVKKAQSTKKWQNAKKASTKAKYENQAADKAEGNKILQRSGDLKKSVMLGKVTDSFLEIGSSLPYARIHQLGGTIKSITIRPKNSKVLAIPTSSGTVFRMSANIPERKIPARPYLAIQGEDVPVISEKVHLFIIGGTI